MAVYSGLLAAKAIKKRTSILNKIHIAENKYNNLLLQGNVQEAKKQRRVIERYKNQGKYKPKVSKRGSLFSFFHDFEQTTRTKGFNQIDKQTVQKIEDKAVKKLLKEYDIFLMEGGS